MSSWLPSLIGAGLCSLVACRLLLGWARSRAFIDRPGAEAHKRQARAVPYGGGAGIMLALLIGTVLAWTGGGVSTDRLMALAPLVGGSLGLFVLGLLDDLRNLPARLKLLLQCLIVVAALYPTDLRIDFLQDWPVLAIGGAVFWCVLVTNAYNLLDHADGVSATVAVISALVLMIAALLGGDTAFALLTGILIATLLGFLWWNRPPARIYMGDAGSLPLGFLLGVGALQVTFWPSARDGSTLAVLTPVLITAIPLYDTAVVLAKRLHWRRPLFTGDRNHISHRLVRLGLGSHASLVAVAALQAALAGSALLLRQLSWHFGLVVLAQAFCVLTLAVLLEARRDRGE